MSDAWQSIKVVDQRRRHAGYSRPHDGRKNSRELANKTVNVIMLTTESSPAMKERRKAAGVKRSIVKPFKGDAVLETFYKLAN
ncbi:AmiR/NasT family two-component response regulator [Burkholderia sp. OAS925]|nr:AmiR/NasT family two-component response regulator [Paraburkholderia graminis]